MSKLPRKPKGLLAKSELGGSVALPSPVGTTAPDLQPHQHRSTAIRPATSRYRLRRLVAHREGFGDVVRGCAPRTHPNDATGATDHPRARDWPKPTSWVCHHRPPRVSPAESRINAGRPLVPCHATHSAHDRGDRGPCTHRTSIRPNRRDVRLFADYRMPQSRGRTEKRLDRLNNEVVILHVR